VTIPYITDGFCFLSVIQERQICCVEECTDLIDYVGELMGGNARDFIIKEAMCP
jgi:hypothetical protein